MNKFNDLFRASNHFENPLGASKKDVQTETHGQEPKFLLSRLPPYTLPPESLSLLLPPNLTLPHIRQALPNGNGCTNDFFCLQYSEISTIKTVFDIHQSKEFIIIEGKAAIHAGNLRPFLSTISATATGLPLMKTV
ncbi:MAG: hypothetical protein OCD03_03145 [Hyphomicrobiales bacterium]